MKFKNCLDDVTPLSQREISPHFNVWPPNDWIWPIFHVKHLKDPKKRSPTYIWLKTTVKRHILQKSNFFGFWVESRIFMLFTRALARAKTWNQKNKAISSQDRKNEVLPHLIFSSYFLRVFSKVKVKFSKPLETRQMILGVLLSIF